MALPWIKLYFEMLHDPKLRRFSATEKWIWVGLLLLSGDAEERGVLKLCDGVPYTNDDLADQLNLGDEESEALGPFLDKAQKLKMLVVDADGIIYISNFDKRQYDKPSDKPEAVKERVRKHREKKKADSSVTPSNCNANVTPCNTIDKDIDIDTDRDKEAVVAEKEVIVNNACAREEKKAPAAAVNLFRYFEQEFGRPLSPMEAELIHDWEKDHPPELIIEALKRAIKKGVRKFNYIGSILNDWRKQNLRTLEEVLDQDPPERNSSKKGGRDSPSRDFEDDKFAHLYLS